MNSSSWELRELCYKVVVKRFHDKLFGVMKPLMDMFTPKPPPTPKSEVEAKIKSPPPPPSETEIATISGKNQW